MTRSNSRGGRRVGGLCLFLAGLVFCLTLPLASGCGGGAKVKMPDEVKPPPQGIPKTDSNKTVK